MKYLLVLLLIVFSCNDSHYKELPKGIEQKVFVDTFQSRSILTYGYVYDTNNCKNIAIYDSHWNIDIERTNWINEMQMILDREYSNAKFRVAEYRRPYLKRGDKDEK
jgi:hypothetical protein